MVTKTMAILADTGEFPPALIEVLAMQDLRLLFISENEAKKQKLIEELKHLKTAAEVDFTSCEREGCWEADMIVLYKPDIASSSLIQKIKEVATQKIVLVISKANKQFDKPDLRKMLPNSKLVEIDFNLHQKGITLCSGDIEAKAEIHKIFEASGYQIN